MHPRPADAENGSIPPEMVGRVLRPAPGKANAIVLDHSGAVFRHGFVEDRVDWTLDPDKRSDSPTHAARLRSGYSSRLLECSQCGSIRIAGEACRHCGFLPQRPPKAIVFNDGDLALVNRERRTAEPVSDPNERMRWHAELTYIAAERGYKPGWVGHMYRTKFGTWPPIRDIKPIQPSPEVLSWVRAAPSPTPRPRNAQHEQAQQGEGAASRRLYHWFLKGDAWRSLSPNARAIYVEIVERYNGTNNGRISFSIREGADLLHIGKNAAAKGFTRASRARFHRRRQARRFQSQVQGSDGYRMAPDRVLVRHRCQLCHQRFYEMDRSRKTKHGTCERTDGTCERTVGYL